MTAFLCMYGHTYSGVHISKFSSSQLWGRILLENIEEEGLCLYTSMLFDIFYGTYTGPFIYENHMAIHISHKAVMRTQEEACQMSNTGQGRSSGTWPIIGQISEKAPGAEASGGKPRVYSLVCDLSRLSSSGCFSFCNPGSET